MSAQVAILSSGRVERAPAAVPARRPDRGAVLISYGVFAVYGVLRWATMLASPSDGRLLGMVLLGVLVAWLGGFRRTARRDLRRLTLFGIVLASIAVLPMAGFPLAWFAELRISLIARAIGRGLDALPGVIVPYAGARPATAHVIMLGAGLLLLAGALALCTRRPTVGVTRLIAAAVPLTVLAIVPSALAEPHAAALHGVVLFGLLACLIFAERVTNRRAHAAVVFIAATAVAAVLIAPSVEAARPWINAKTLAGAAAGSSERFNWSQTYGPLHWPQHGTTVLDVAARFPAYWKAETLDGFDGRGWVGEPVASGDPVAGVRRAALERWTETLTVTVRDVSTTNVIAAGVAEPPAMPGGETGGGFSPGTYVTTEPLTAGDRYNVLVYAPSPSSRELSVAGTRYPAAIRQSELQVALPLSATGATSTIRAQPYQFSPYGAGSRLAAYGGLDAKAAAAEVSASTYGPVLSLAERLEARTRTPYQYVRAVLGYLSHGFSYSQATPRTGFPLLRFLLGTHTGYCQQFAGAMALLLRMGGVPARVAAGFTTGSLDPTTHRYMVADFDAHSWVEAWFPGYGWVALDPTPAGRDPALAGHASAGSDRAGLEPSHQRLVTSRHGSRPRAAATARRRRGHNRAVGSASTLEPLVIVLVVFALLGLLALLRRRRRATPATLLAELERAFAWCGRPLSPETTLAGLEASCADVPEAAAYVGAIRRARYAGEGVLPSEAQRRAMRARLRRGLGPLGFIRALIALPPWPRRVLH